ncbi:Uncharacterized protein ToN1_41310 [Aromatoleum petrolei]|nr:Uncharacterized protein ToN1_41310 [Aromatoleum petrolei]
MAGEVSGEAKSRVAANEAEREKDIALAAGGRCVERHGALLEARCDPNPDRSDTSDPVDTRAALLKPRPDVWVKRPATV